jgi:hypothetical protein
LKTIIRLGEAIPTDLDGRWPAYLFQGQLGKLDKHDIASFSAVSGRARSSRGGALLAFGSCYGGDDWDEFLALADAGVVG